MIGMININMVTLIMNMPTSWSFCPSLHIAVLGIFCPPYVMYVSCNKIALPKLFELTDRF